MNNIEKKINLLSYKNYINEINDILKEYQDITSEETHLGTTKQKHHGIFYTNYNIAYKITEETFKDFKNDINNNLFFEPSVGLGIFVITYLDYIEKNFNNYDITKIVNNIFISDIDDRAISLAKKLIKKFILIKFNQNIDTNKDNIYIGDILMDEEFNFKDTNVLFGKDIRFDFILSNPPYRNVKASRKELTGVEYDNYRNYCLMFSKSTKKSLLYQRGTLNLYKIFLELILEKYTHDSAAIGIIIPSSILSDKSTIYLRKRILEKTNLKTIYYIEEKSKQFENITQAMCFFALQKTKNSNNEIIELIDFDNRNKSFSIMPNNLLSIDSNYSFNKIDELSNKILIKIHKFTKLKDINSIKNLRGELDLTADKKYITSHHSKYMLLQGKNIKEWSYTKNLLYVDEEFTSSRNSEKFKDINSERIICQQISNINSNKRMKFAKIPKNIILGNSCNYIVSDLIPIDYLLGLFNSYLFDWRFQLFSSNNHINNYELDDLPINIIDKKDEIINCVQEILEGKKDKIITLNLLIFSIYGLNTKEIITIMQNYNDKHAKEIIRIVSSGEQ